MSEKLRAVLDTQIFLRTIIKPNSISTRILPRLWVNVYDLYISSAVEAEIVEVLTRSSIRRKFPWITDEIVEPIVQMLREDAIRVEPMLPVEAVSRDPKDDIFLACARAANAHYLVSEDNDLLVLGTYHCTEIVNVPTFLAILQQRKAGA